MKTQKRIICVMLLLSLMQSLFLPLTVSAEGSYTVSGLWLIDTEPELPSATINQSVTFTTNYDDTVFNTMDIYSSSIYMGNDSLGTMAYSNSTWNDDGYRYVNFGDTPQAVSKEYYGWLLLSGSKVSYKPSGVVDDLSKDKNFDVNNYPHNAADYSLDVIQIAEGENGNLYVYVYQPSDATRDYEAKYINMSVQNPADRDLEYYLYSLKLINSYGTVDKYIVNDFTISSDSDRYYNISTIYRSYDEEVDTVPEAVDTIQCKGYDVGECWHVYYYNGSLTYEMKEIDVVEVTIQATGSIRYDEGFKLYYDACDSHYVAFSIDNYNVSQIYDADITYTLNYYEWANIYTIGGGRTDKLISSTLIERDYLSSKETASNDGDGWFGEKYTWNRIQDVSTFISEAQNDARDEFSEEELAGLEQAQFVFRFVETPYTMVTSPNASSGTYTLAENIGILRLHFLADGKYYNLGVVSDLVGTDAKPELGVSNMDNIINAMDEYLGDFLAFLMLIILVVIILVVLVYLKPVASMIWKGIKEIFSLILSVITLPFQLIASLFSGKRK